MAWTYANAPGTATAAQRRDAVRMLTGDTDSTMSVDAPQLTATDEEIAYALSRSGDVAEAAAVQIAGVLYARWARLPDTQVVGVGSVNVSDMKLHLRQVQTDLQADLAKGAAPRFGGQSITENRRLAALPDVPQPTFVQGGDTYPGTQTTP